ncbi:MAG: aryl-sulfate sulfotransferase, partial [Solirubrobacterales bacterium]|nr:aryl-sulfate sulfotransferase [Solirubrobacterales bacterium]
MRLAADHGGCRRDGRVRGAAAALVISAAMLAGCAGGYTEPAADVTGTTATVHGVVFAFEPADPEIDYWFEFGPTKAYGASTPHRSLEITDRDNHPVSEDLTGLEPGTTYHYRVCAEDTVAVCAQDEKLTTAGGAGELVITASPSLDPGFDPGVSDYVTRCDDSPVTVDVTAPAGMRVSVDGGSLRNGTFSQQVPLAAGESFRFVVDDGDGLSTHHVRCLPGNFPAYSWTSPGNPSANFYITMPRNVQTPGGDPAGRYVAVFDDHGVPVWWMESSTASDAKLLPDGNLAWGRNEAGGTAAAGFEVHELDGTLVKTWRTVGANADIHDFQALPNGNVLIGSYPARAGTRDLTAYGGPATNGTPIDAEIQEIRPDGSVAWSWEAKDHIDLDQTPQRWRGWVYGLPYDLPDGREGFDWAHMNSFEKVGGELIVSFRHLDAVYAIDIDSGDVVWKLGGTTTPTSLTVEGDPESNPLGGQHYARILPGGNLTVYDNNTFEA